MKASKKCVDIRKEWFNIQPATVLSGLGAAELRELAKKDEKTTQYGSASYISRIKNRSAKFTEIIYGEPNASQQNTMRAVMEYLKNREMVWVERTMCQHEDAQMLCRFFVTKDYARIGYMWHQTLMAPVKREQPDIMTVDVPEWPERRVLVWPAAQATFVLGTDYMGEIKKAHLRMAMWLAKQQGWLGLHAASKLIKIKTTSGKVVSKGAILFGLSGTGKTTLSCHNHGLSGDEGVTIRQDDVVLMRGDGFCFGTENNFYLKTEGLEPTGQPLLHKAATSSNAVFENVHVAEDGKVDFLNYSLTSNGRGVVFRSDMKPYSDGDIDLPKLDMVIFIIRRRDIVPPVARLNREQAAAMFMLGESVETSAGDPTQAGKALRVVGTNPFIVGPAEEEGNIFLKLLESNPSAECFALNTGRVGGKDGENITVVDSANIVKQIARGGISWVKDPNWGFEVPEKVEGMDYARFDLKRFYNEEQLKDHVKKLKQERREWLGQFKSLKPEIAQSLGL